MATRYTDEFRRDAVRIAISSADACSGKNCEQTGTPHPEHLPTGVSNAAPTEPYSSPTASKHRTGDASTLALDMY